MFQQKINNGSVRFKSDINRNSFTSSNHNAVIDGWVAIYGTDDDTKARIRMLKTQDSGTAQRDYKKTIFNGNVVKFFILSFSEKQNGKREYFEASAMVELTSADSETRKLIRGYYLDIAILAVTNGSDKYTLKLLT